MAYIQLDDRYPGIVSLFMYKQGIAKHFTALGEEIMRGPSELSRGERELIGAYVSKQNNCEFCSSSHAACAAEFMDPATVQTVVFEGDLSVVSDTMRALLRVADTVRTLDRHRISIGIEEAVRAAKNAGATDGEIHDTVLITSFFCMCNRYVDGLGTTFQAGEEIKGGQSLAKYGYKMSLRRFFGEVIPELWRSLWNRS